MFERFTDRARRVVVLAQDEARMLNHQYIGTEHILLGLIHEGEGVAAEVLVSLGVDLESVRVQVQEIVGRGSTATAGHIPFTPRAKKVLELSLREALQLGHNYIGTEHILLGLIREGQGVAAQVLDRLGVGLDRARQRVIQMLSGLTGPVSTAAMRLGDTTIDVDAVVERGRRVQALAERLAEFTGVPIDVVLSGLLVNDQRLAVMEAFVAGLTPGEETEPAKPDEPDQSTGSDQSEG